ncbi:MAG: site-2 protease family protein [Oscillospiraceae bacterium]|nr:site-2 protease family protein [Oscillospiraceae bacterium]
MLYILVAVLMFGILIALHEFGHFAAAKLCGVKVNEFAIGMGPRLFHKKGKETEYTIRALPIGGFCAMEGEEEGESQDPRAFPNRPWWQRLMILLAGVFMNFLTGLIIILCMFSTAGGFYTTEVTGFVEGAAAASVLRAGDRICTVDGHAILLQSDVSFFVSRAIGDTLDMTVESTDGIRRVLTDVPLSKAVNQTTGEETLILGIYMQGVEEATIGVKLRNSWYQAVDYVRMVWIGLGDLISGQVGLRDMSGVVGIVDMVGDLGEEGAAAAEAAGTSPLLGALENILWFGAFIAINLAVMNLLPIPALDGGQIFFMAVNGILLAVRGKKLDPKYQGWVTVAGFACLMLLMVAVTVSDVLKQFGI